MSQVFRRQKLKMMGYPMELLHEMIVLISKNVVFRSTMGCQGDLFQRPSRKIADETWIFLGFNDFSTNKPWFFAILGAYPEVEMQNDMQQLQQAWFV